MSSKSNSKYPGINNLSSSIPRQGASPRTKAVREFLLTHSSSKIQLAYQFIHSHLKLLLKVISVDMNENNPVITSGDFNHLNLVFAESDLPLCKHIPYFNAKPRVGLEEISVWISNKLLSPAEAPQSDSVVLNGLNKGMTIKTGNECNGWDLRICNYYEAIFTLIW